jgi:hypothetical protein
MDAPELDLVDPELLAQAKRWAFPSPPPLYRREVFEAFTRLTVEVESGGQDLTISIPERVAVSSTLLHKKVGNLLEHAIRRALDRLFTGF